MRKKHSAEDRKCVQRIVAVARHSLPATMQAAACLDAWRKVYSPKTIDHYIRAEFAKHNEYMYPAVGRRVSIVWRGRVHHAAYRLLRIESEEERLEFVKNHRIL